VTVLFQAYEYATAKSEVESFFWKEMADNYLEMAKKRLYDGGATGAGARYGAGTRYALYHVLLAVLKLLAPFLPYVTEEIYLALFVNREGGDSIHTAAWPTAETMLPDEKAIAAGQILVAIATAVRRYKSEHNLALGVALTRLQVATEDVALAGLLRAGTVDLASITRAQSVIVSNHLDPELEALRPREG
jgi:valyl-tRNA synthetase